MRGAVGAEHEAPGASVGEEGGGGGGGGAVPSTGEV